MTAKELTHELYKYPADMEVELEADMQMFPYHGEVLVSDIIGMDIVKGKLRLR